MKSATILTIIIVCSLFSRISADAATVKLVLRFEAPAIEALEGGFCRVVFDHAMQAGRPGEPSYPFRGAQALLPPGHAVTGTRIVRREWTGLAGAHRLYPAQRVAPSSETERSGRRFLYDAPSYAVDHWVSPPDGELRTQYFRGHAIAVGAVSPVEYRPASNEIGYYRTVEIHVETASADESRDALALLRRDRETVSRLGDIIDNPDALASYDGLAAPSADPAAEFEYLIITSRNFAAAFEPLRAFYTRRGMRAEIVTTQSIDVEYPGIDGAEKVRNCIKDRYISNGITHVLLGGDWDGASSSVSAMNPAAAGTEAEIAGSSQIVPFRGLCGRVYSSVVYEDANMPSDIYFSNLDGAWNEDGDALWGEAGEEDLYSEVAVGRAPVDAPGEIASFIAKTIAYQESPVVSEARTALLLGELLWNDPLTYGDDEMELLVGERSDNGFATTGIPTDFAIARKYDRVAYWTGSEAIEAIGGGANWLAHAGHSNQGYVMRMDRSDATDGVLTNDGIVSGFPIALSTGCYAGSFDNRLTSGSYDPFDCIAEELVTITNGFAAFVCNSRYGWFTEGTTNGPSIHIMREFMDAVFTEGYTTVGAAHARSKNETVPFLYLPDEWEPGAVRWCFFESNLLGDPALDGWTDMPRSIEASYAPEIGRGDTCFAVDARAPGAVACLSRDGVAYGRGVADLDGRVSIALSTAPPEEATWLELNITAHNRLVLRDIIEIVEIADAGFAAPGVRLEQNYPNPFNPSTTIRFTLPRDCAVELAVFDVAGRLVERLAGGRLSAGPHAVTWAPDGIQSGVYFYSLSYEGVTLTKKAMILR